MPVVIPFRKSAAQSVRQIRVFRQTNPTEILADTVCCEPIPADRGIGIFRKLCHFSGTRIGNDVKRSVFIIRIDRAYLRHIACCGGKCNQIVVTETLFHQGGGRFIQFFHNDHPCHFLSIVSQPQKKVKFFQMLHPSSRNMRIILTEYVIAFSLFLRYTVVTGKTKDTALCRSYRKEQ